MSGWVEGGGAEGRSRGAMSGEEELREGYNRASNSVLFNICLDLEEPCRGRSRGVMSGWVEGLREDQEELCRGWRVEGLIEGYNRASTSILFYICLDLEESCRGGWRGGGGAERRFKPGFHLNSVLYLPRSRGAMSGHGVIQEHVGKVLGLTLLGFTPKHQLYPLDFVWVVEFICSIAVDLLQQCIPLIQFSPELIKLEAPHQSLQMRRPIRRDSNSGIEEEEARTQGRHQCVNKVRVSPNPAATDT
ncbi:hypothetical protein RRG08_052921 [Elysia crispata]|uniref:Uncharacterized protein n=1 Tax=Elysia crispata TaxID=231223 RepID=A0AAE1D3P1_9GAST|nr:hypothetical protein RRG08_052921 [Elysia crispata]